MEEIIHVGQLIGQEEEAGPRTAKIGDGYGPDGKRQQNRLPGDGTELKRHDFSSKKETEKHKSEIRPVNIS